MGIQIGARPDAGFDDPIGMLKDCHRRIERFLHILCLVAERGQGRALTEEEREAVQAALHYFRVGGVRHTADEEESLFPRMRATAAAAPAVSELESLESDHRRANDLHDAVEMLYQAWITAGRLSQQDSERLLRATQQLGQLYEAHIRLEEGTVFPRAAEMLDPQTIASIGQEFERRRK